MKKSFMAVPLLCAVLLCFSSCVSTGEKAISVAVVYCVTAVFSVMVFLIYMFGIRKKNLWFVLLFASVFVVNVGYCALAISQTLEEALLANRISYFGSVFLPMTMLMIIFDAIKIQYGKWLKKEQSIMLLRVMKKLKSEYFLVLYLTYFEGFSGSETAAIMKKSKRQSFQKH